MRSYLHKVRHIVLPLVLMACVMVPAYMFLRWTLDLRTGIVQLNADLWDFWIPLALPWIPLSLGFRRRFHILKFKRNDDNGWFATRAICAFALTAPLVVSQHYVVKAAGGMTELEDVGELDAEDHARFYRVRDFVVASWHGGSHGTAHTSGKYGQTLNYELFFVAPIIAHGDSSVPDEPRIWYGVKFHESLGNGANDARKEAAWNAFWDRSLHEMERYDYHDLDHFERTPFSDDRRAFLEAIASRTGTAGGDEVILTPVKEPYGTGHATRLAWIFGSFGIGLGVLLLFLILPRLDTKELYRQRKGEFRMPKEDDLRTMLGWLVPKGDHFTTALIIDINILVFALMVLSGLHPASPRTSDLIAWGANTSAHTPNGEPWRLITSMFVHGGIMHLAMNMFGLVMASLALESGLGRLRFGLFYLVSGLAGAIASLWWHNEVVSVGASGAIFGMYGTLFGVYIRYGDDAPGAGMLEYIGMLIFFGLAFGMLPGIDNAAHIGGLLCGVLLGAVFPPTKRKARRRKRPSG